MVKIKSAKLDVLKPTEELSASRLVKEIASLKEIERVTMEVEEVDQGVETIMLEVKGEDIEIKEIEKTIKKLGATLHSIDKIEAKSE